MYLLYYLNFIYYLLRIILGFDSIVFGSNVYLTFIRFILIYFL